MSCIRSVCLRDDLLTQVSGLSFDEALEGHVVVPVADLDVRFIGRKALIRNKRAVGRDKDLADLAILERQGE